MPRTIVISFGLRRRLAETLDRARRYGTDIHLVPAIPSAVRGLRRHRSALVTVHDEPGRAGLDAALGLDEQTVLILHEDVLLAPEGAARLLEVADDTGDLAIPRTNHPDVDGATGTLPPDVVQPVGQPQEPRPVTRVRNVCLAGFNTRVRRLLRHRLTAASTRLFLDEGGAVLVPEVVATHLDEGRDQLEPPVGPDGRPLVVAAMIVRDEERFLPGCLASLEDLVDRIEVCDTGSTDRTVEIAHAAGAHVTHAAWRDDFAWARNQVLEQCRDAWWVLQVDADERVRCQDPEQFRHFLATALPDRDGFDVPLQDIAEDGTRLGGQQLPRLFPARGTEYVGRVHEVPRYDDGQLLPWTVTRELEIEHLGYQSEVVQERDKHARNLQLARADYAEEATPIAMLQLARSLRLSDETLDEQLDVLGQLWELMEAGTDGLNEVGHIPVYQLYSQALLQDARPDQAWEVISAGLSRYPYSPILRAVHGEIAVKTGHFSDVTDAEGDAEAAGDAARPWAAPLAEATATLQQALSRLATDDTEGAAQLIEQLLEDGVPSPLGRWGEIVSVVALSAPDRVVELLLPAAADDHTGDALRAVGMTFEPSDAARFAVEVLDRTSPPTEEQERAAVGIALTADAPEELSAMLERCHTLTVATVEEEVLEPPPAVAAWLQQRRGRSGDELLQAARSGDEQKQVRALVEDRTGRAMRELAREDAAGAARLAAAAVDEGGTAPAQLRTALGIAIVAGDVPATERLVTHLDDLGDELLTTLVERAVQRDQHEIAALVARGFFPRLPSVATGRPRDERRLARILGMHRSGTSVYAHVARELGADVGPEQELIPPAPDNPRGFHEHRPLVLVADRLLALLGGTWDAPPELPERPTDDLMLRALVGGAAATLDRLLDATEGTTLWKDPRLSLLLPVWDLVVEQLVAETHEVHVVRDPDEVVASLGRRSAMHPEHAARLWMRYVTDTCRSRPGAALLRPEDLFDDPRGTAGRLAVLLGLPDPPSHRLDAAAGVIDPGLQRRRVHHEDAGPWLVAAREVDDHLRDHDVPAAIAAADTATERLRLRHEERQPLAVLGPAHRPGDLGRTPTAATLWLAEPTAADRYEATSLGWTVTEEPVAQVVRAARPRGVWLDGTAQTPRVVAAVTRATPRSPIAATREHPALDEVVAMDEAPAWLSTAELLPLHPQRIATIEPRPRTDATSVVVPVHGKWELTDRCLTALQENTTVPIEVIVVDDASPDDTREQLDGDDRVDVVVPIDDNVGFPGAVNAGLRAASGSWMCILNNDTEPQMGWLSSMLRELDDDTALVGPRTNEISGPQRVADAPASHGGLEPARRWAGSYLQDAPARSWPLGRLVGFCLLGRAELFETIGGLDEGVGVGNFEDDEFCARAREHGRMRVVDDSLVLHVGSATFGTSDRWRRAMLEGARHVDGRVDDAPDPLAVVVLADGDPDAARTSVYSARVLRAPVYVAERGAPQIHVAWIDELGGAISLRQVDWTARPTIAEITGRDTPSVIVLLAGEQLDVTDTGAIRAAAEQHPAAGISGLSGQRLMGPSDEVTPARLETDPDVLLPGVSAS